MRCSYLTPGRDEQAAGLGELTDEEVKRAQVRGKIAMYNREEHTLCLIAVA